jgi:single-strand DNA-binding protein
MSNLNKCIFIGRLGKDPEAKQISQDFKVVNFSLAISEKWTDKASGERKEATEWINCQASNKVSEIVEKYVHKGDLLYVEGKFKTRSWEKEGVKQYASFIQVESVQLFPKAKENQTDENPPTYESPVKNSGLPPGEMAYSNPKTEPEEDDLPF